MSCADDDGARALAGRTLARRQHPGASFTAPPRTPTRGCTTRSGPTLRSRHRRDDGSASNCGSGQPQRAQRRRRLRGRAGTRGGPGGRRGGPGAHFTGAARRFDFKGEGGGVRVYDDYAHHPTEVRAALPAARAVAGRHQSTCSSSRTCFPAPASSTASSARRCPWRTRHWCWTSIRPAKPHPGRDQRSCHQGTGHRRRARFHGPRPHPLVAACAPGDVVLTAGAGDVTEPKGPLIVRRPGRDTGNRSSRWLAPAAPRTRPALRRRNPERIRAQRRGRSSRPPSAKPVAGRSVQCRWAPPDTRQRQRLSFPEPKASGANGLSLSTSACRRRWSRRWSRLPSSRRCWPSRTSRSRETRWSSEKVQRPWRPWRAAAAAGQRARTHGAAAAAVRSRTRSCRRSRRHLAVQIIEHLPVAMLNQGSARWWVSRACSSVPRGRAWASHGGSQCRDEPQGVFHASPRFLANYRIRLLATVSRIGHSQGRR